MPRVRLPVQLAALAAPDDRALLARFADGRDEAAFAALVGRHGRMVYGVCRRAVRDEHLAEDAFQAVFLVLAKNPAGAARSASVGGWLFGIARRVGMAARRHELRRESRVGRAHAPPEPRADFDDLLRVLDEELARLPEAFRAPLVACFLEERTLDEAARHLGWSLSTLRRRLDRGKELLRARLTRRGATLAGGLLAGVLAPAAGAAPPKLAAPSALAVRFAAEAGATVFVKAWLPVLAFAVALGGLAVGFAGDQPDPPRPNPAPGVTARAVAPGPRPSELTPWVTVTGRVVFPEERDVPKPRVVPVGAIKDADFFAPFGVLTYGDVLIQPKSRGLANAVVWLRPDSDEPKAAFPADKIHPKLAAAKPRDHVVQAGPDGFTPRVLALRVGDRVVFGNPTPIPFNVHYHRNSPVNSPMGGETGEFNMLLPPGKTHTTTVPALRFCDTVRDAIHPWVNAYVWAFDHPYSAVTDADGRFALPDVPAGAWRLVVWHERVGYRNAANGRLGEIVVIRGAGKADLGRVVHASHVWDEVGRKE